MKYLITLTLVIAVSSNINAALNFGGVPTDPFAFKPDASTGLEYVYVIQDCQGVTISYPSSSNVKWSHFGSNGAAYAEQIAVASSIPLMNQDGGYIAEVDGVSHYFWIVNYANHRLSLNSIVPSPTQADCLRTDIDINGSGDRIIYYTINGRSEELSRELKLSYYTLEYDADNSTYRQSTVSRDIAYIRPIVSIDAPLCDTRFILSGDRFLEYWKTPLTVESDVFNATAVAAETSAVQNRREVDNEQHADVTELGGSAPCEIDFSATVTDAAVFYEWQLARNAEFDPIDDRYQQTDLSYTFRDQGTTYVRFFAANADGNCDYIGSVYQVMIGESSLLCPNAFTPEASPGINDEWKVSYKSIISFECHIFNRWGTEMFSFTDPSVGWDGKYNGKFVPAGTYFYVIKAKGADGREYKLSGDINIIGSKSINHQNPVE